MRVGAIEAALKANWSAGALDNVKVSADGLLSDIHGIGGLSRQPGQGDGAARGGRCGLIAPKRNTICERRAAMRAVLFWSIRRKRRLPRRPCRRDN